MNIRTLCTSLGVKYYIYKKSKATEIVRYWDRRKGMWSKWFSNDCYYNTNQGVNRIYNKLMETFHKLELRQKMDTTIYNGEEKNNETRT